MSRQHVVGAVAPCGRERHHEADRIRQGEIVRCRWYAWEIDVRSERPRAGPETHVRICKGSVEVPVDRQEICR